MLIFDFQLNFYDFLIDYQHMLIIFLFIYYELKKRKYNLQRFSAIQKHLCNSIHPKHGITYKTEP